MAAKKKTGSVKVEIDFANPEAAEHFVSWLCGSGEQQYWQWMEYREQEEEEGDITALNFDYHSANGKKFGLKVLTTCGRMDKR